MVTTNNKGSLVFNFGVGKVTDPDDQSAQTTFPNEVALHVGMSIRSFQIKASAAERVRKMLGVPTDNPVYTTRTDGPDLMVRGDLRIYEGIAITPAMYPDEQITSFAMTYPPETRPPTSVFI